VAGVHQATQPNGISFRGEVWTDARGRATVSLPPDAYPERAELEYALRVIETDTTARVASELREGRFSIETGEPHVKVAWRISSVRQITEDGAAS
jgi:hypothetical protein